MSDPLLRRQEVEREIGLSRSTIHRQVAEGLFPKPIRVGVRSVRWRESDIEKWKQQHIDEPLSE